MLVLYPGLETDSITCWLIMCWVANWALLALNPVGSFQWSIIEPARINVCSQLLMSVASFIASQVIDISIPQLRTYVIPQFLTEYAYVGGCGWVESMGVVSECCCKEVYYRYPHNNYYFSLLHLY